ncbi:hypothetical protein COCNU_scaffold146430G000010 [Cocos nucifera]|nr:hypothetical protein [Cocos nucifera]
MDLKRACPEEREDDGGSLVKDAKRRRTFLNSSMREVMGANYIQRHLSKLEPFLRKVVSQVLLSFLRCLAILLGWNPFRKVFLSKN